MHNPFSLQGKTILVTGASSGIGKATAIECSRMGALLIITGRDEKRLNQTFYSLEGEGHIWFVADLTDDKQIETLVEKLPKLDGVVHSAGVLNPLPAKFIDKYDISETLNINLFSIILLNKNLICKKKFNIGVSIIFISSAILYANHIGYTLYAASKGAINASARILGNELTDIKARVNIISPGMVETPMINYLSQEEKLNDQKKYPLGYGSPEDVAYCAIYLLSNASKWVTGSEFIIDGGVLKI